MRRPIFVDVICALAIGAALAVGSADGQESGQAGAACSGCRGVLSGRVEGARSEPTGPQAPAQHLRCVEGCRAE